MKLTKAILENIEKVECAGCGKTIKNYNYIEVNGETYCPGCAAFMTESKLEENYGDTTDYTDLIKKYVKNWWKENADFGYRLFKGAVEVEAKYTEDEFHKPVAYKCTMSALFVETEEFAEEIGIYVADRIPSIEYVKFTHDDEVSSENYEDVCIYWKQNQEIPDFGENIFDSEKLSEGYSLGDDKESFDIFDKNCEKLHGVMGYFISKGIPVLTTYNTKEKGIMAQISQDSIYYAIIQFINFDGKYIGPHLRADGYDSDYMSIDIDALVAKKAYAAEEIKDAIEGKEL